MYKSKNSKRNLGVKKGESTYSLCKKLMLQIHRLQLTFVSNTNFNYMYIFTFIYKMATLNGIQWLIPTPLIVNI